MDNQYSSLTEQYSNKNDGYYNLERMEMLPFIPEGVRSVIEVGCGGGGFGSLIKRRSDGASVWGVEPSEEAASVARQRLDKVICGTFQSNMPELEGESFECIVFNDILEHLVNPEQALLDAKNYLSENGVVVASIPNILYFPEIFKIIVEQDWEYQKEGILDSTHLRFFTKKSIVRMFENCGFEIVNVAGINPCRSKKYNLANILCLNHLKDWRYLQFAVVAK